ncbi:pirin family protein [Rhodobium gokarnense]|uniref:Redox-sensitive bicupin YhaK (Pirin superfamily) n=1 Tax=Rhodobium gokarnense TaxID=364296 RepID=A0ABT3HDC8_9HYPH|nr:pirin family protein [Rhodobium gokarnense]MCW2308417.1 redox-sensitive bicupin YhaK (pirin superfamily) [Rhodobium gokarnense]
MSVTDIDQKIRPVVFRTDGMNASDGAGVRMRRMLGTPRFDFLDPFLMLDWFHSDQPQDYLAGFPDHPHRGFETVTYLLHGRMRHADNRGNAGVIEPGGIQWMTAGSGIVHSEMPEQENGLLSGFQLWINLPAKDKMVPAGYQEFAPDRIPVEERAGATLRVITGTTSGGVSGPVVDRPTDPFFADIYLDPGATLDEAIGGERNAFVLVHDGTLTLAGANGPETLGIGHLAVLGTGDVVSATAGEDGAKFLLIAARPLSEPVARAGPFVMNTEAELHQAFADFQNGRF